MNAESSGQARLTLLVYVALLLAILAAIIVILTQQPAPAQVTIIPQPPTATPSPITIYISGEVAQPGTYSVAFGSRVETAIQAAGGMTSTANTAGVNLAAPVRDGDQIHVPAIGAADVVLATPSGGERLRINEATLEQLDTLPGIGPALAERILTYRSEVGAFSSLDDLGNVEGIGAALLQELAPLIRFD
jgi:competence protein ComEA